MKIEEIYPGSKLSFDVELSDDDRHRFVARSDNEQVPTHDCWTPASGLAVDLTDRFVKKGYDRPISFSDSCEVEVIDFCGVECYAAQQTIEHNDCDFPQWTALLVLKTAGHTISVADSAGIATPQVGQILLFNIHQEHCLDLPDDIMPDDLDDDEQSGLRRWLTPDPQKLFIAAHVDFNIKDQPGALPSRELIESLLQHSLSLQYQPTQEIALTQELLDEPTC